MSVDAERTHTRIDIGLCPQCGSGGSVIGKTRTELNLITVRHKCDVCATEWDRHYGYMWSEYEGKRYQSKDYD